MKKIVLVFAFTLLLFYDTSSQNIIETYRWINATFLEMMVSNKCEYTKFSIQLYQDTVTHEITSIGVDIAYKTEKDTIYTGVKMPLNNIIVYEMPPNDNCYFIGFCPKSGTFRGGAIHNKNNYEITLAEYKEDLPLMLWFKKNPMYKEKVKKLVKAFQHLIKLSGGIVPNEDLF